MIADLQPYPEYKESSSKWLGKIPSGWEAVPLGRPLVQRIEQNRPVKTKYILSLSLRQGVIPYSEKKSGGNKAKNDLSAYTLAYPGDIVLNSMNVVVGSVGLSKYFGAVSPVYYVLHTRSEKDSIFFFDALFQDKTFQQSLWGLGNGILFLQSKTTGKFNTIRMRIPMHALRRVVIPQPPPDEQAAIVRFLDWANGRLERAIRAKRKVIALLNEQKQAIIHRAVTRGLDPSVTLKPSGIPWLGDIPQHWEVRRLKWVLWLQRGFDLPADRRKSGNVPVYSSGGHIDNHNVALATSPGVVIGRYGSTDAVFFVTEPYWPHNTALFTTTFYDNHARWCFYLLRSIAKGAYAGKSAVPGVDRKDLFDIVVPRPPVREQCVIAEAIEEQLAAFDRSSETIAKEIELLREYRTRLVADVVTGKLDVRAAAKLPEESDDIEPLDGADALTEGDEDTDGEALDTVPEEAEA